MRRPVRSQEAAYRIARPSAQYADEVSQAFIDRQQAQINRNTPKGFQLTPVSGDAW
jgi:hypothetical protein